MKEIISVERLKLKRSKIWILYILGPLVGVLLAFINFRNNYDLFMQPGDSEWVEVWTQVAIFMGPFVLPIAVGIYAAFVCRGEHIGGGWKQLLTLPIGRSKIFMGKFFMASIMVAITLLIVLLFFLSFGFFNGLEGDLPLIQIIIFIVQGFLACLPLLLIQLIVSLRAKTFGIPLAFSIIFTLPAIIVASTPLGQFYPWTQPMLAMSPADESPIESYFLFYCLLIATFSLFLLFGLRSFSKRDIN
ncbi:ABC transporter permease [Bacillus xiapuensis]|uniref:ABC transporter permease n=1 Tax=Bacillus xiapuensis TaxID=2014075 RepID=UPI000C23A75A|nr:ABC transporter permease [Bacillus xiapuensis]